MKLLGSIVALTLLVLTLAFISAVTGGAQACEPAAASPDAAPTGPLPAGKVRIVQANIPQRSRDFAGSLDRIIARKPDFVSLNEVSHRSDRALTRRGYAVFRGPRSSPVSQTRSTAILWRADKWRKVDGGRVLMVPSGPQKWDAGRSATWVTLREVGGSGQVTMVSLHHMINPAKFGPDKPRRQQKYRRGLTKVAALGATFVAGDFNSRYADNDPWGPRQVLGDAGMATAAHASVDMIFHRAGDATPLKQGVDAKAIASDHPMVWGEYDLQGGASGAVQAAGTDRARPAGLARPAPGGGRRVAAARQDETAGLDPTQLANASKIIVEGVRRGLPSQAIVIALATASQESGFRNYANDGKGSDLAPEQRDVGRSLGLPHDAVGTDHGSVGVFQQQYPWWGTLEELMDTTTAAGKFYDKLVAVPGWQSMPVTAAAQAVQRSAFPSAYADDADLARSLLARLDPETASRVAAAAEPTYCLTGVAGLAGSCAPTDSPADTAALTPDARLVLRCTAGTFGMHTFHGFGARPNNPHSDHPNGRAIDISIQDYETDAAITHGNTIAAWLQTHARELGITYIIWRARLWNAGQALDDWRPYTHPSGVSTPSLDHMNHLHVSVHGHQGTGLSTDAGTVVMPLPAGTYVDQDNYRDVSSIRSSWHTGADLAAPCNTPVLAAHSGRVVVEHPGWAGNLVKVVTGSDSVTTWYAHLQQVDVVDGQQVLAGQPIGAVGALGNSTGCHLHFEVHTRDVSSPYQANIDPMAWLRERVGSIIGRPGDGIPA